MNAPRLENLVLRPPYVDRVEKLITEAKLCPKGLIMSGPSLSRAILSARNGRVSLAEAGSSFCFYAVRNFSDSRRPGAVSVVPTFSSDSPDSIFVGLRLFAFNRVPVGYQSEPSDLHDAFALALAMPFDSLSVTYCGTTQKIIYTEGFEEWLLSVRSAPVPMVEFLDLSCSEPPRTPSRNVISAYYKIQKIAAVYGAHEPCSLQPWLSSFIKVSEQTRDQVLRENGDSEKSFGGIVKQLPDLRGLTYVQRLFLLKTVALRNLLCSDKVSGVGLFNHIKNVGSAKLKLGANKLDWSSPKEVIDILGSCFNLNYFCGNEDDRPYANAHHEIVAKYPALIAGCARSTQEKFGATLSRNLTLAHAQAGSLVGLLNEPLYLKIWRLYEV
ncbi:hypothetical protein CL689_06120 [Candidatus Saccharibacteria bacterium]|nr:hypothetical protein [Candidatus Saccharibacteria bacterium]|tara:strand:+ start:957 stop:2108 length:1152 start_codon:yes stop_codon:yes gene_type:complete